MSLSTEYPSLEQLFGAYFHQDWRDEFESPGEAISAFQSDETEKMVSDAKRELDVIMDFALDEISLTNLVTDLGCYYNPSGDGATYSDWIVAIKESLGQKRG